MSALSFDKLAAFYGGTDYQDVVTVGDITAAFEKGYAPSEIPKGKIDQNVWNMAVSVAQRDNIPIPTVGDKSAPETGTRSVGELKQAIRSGNVPENVDATTLNEARNEIRRAEHGPAHQPQPDTSQNGFALGGSPLLWVLAGIAGLWVVLS